MKKILYVLTLILLCVGLSGCSLAKEDVYIVFTSDVHGEVNNGIGYAGVKSYVKELKKDGNVILVDGGDFAEGEPIAENSKGEAIFEIMNEVGYDIAAVGNHELDFGIEATANNFNKAKFGLTSCNLRYVGKNEDPFKKVKPYIIKKIGGVKVAFIGILTPETLFSDKDSYKNNFENGELAIDIYTNPNDGSDDGFELYSRVQAVIDEANSKADYVVALAHLGIYNRNIMNCDNFINNTRGVDIVLDAHAHTDHIGDVWKNVDGEKVVYLAVGCNLERLGLIKINIDGTIETSFVESVSEKDPAVQAKIDELLIQYE